MFYESHCRFERNSGQNIRTGKWHCPNGLFINYHKLIFGRLPSFLMGVRITKSARGQHAKGSYVPRGSHLLRHQSGIASLE